MTQGALDSVEVAPFKVSSIAVVTRDTINMSVPKAEPIVINVLAAAVSRALNESFTGTGAGVAGVEPAGILNLGGIGDLQEARRQAAKERADEKQRVTMMIAERETELRALLARWAAERELQRLYRRFGEIERLARLAD